MFTAVIHSTQRSRRSPTPCATTLLQPLLQPLLPPAAPATSAEMRNPLAVSAVLAFVFFVACVDHVQHAAALPFLRSLVECDTPPTSPEEKQARRRLSRDSSNAEMGYK